MLASPRIRRLTTARVCIALLAAGVCAASGMVPAHAEPARTLPIPDVVVDANAQSPEDALSSLAEQYSFTIERSGQRADTDVVTGHFEGSLDDVVSRVLSNENHLIHHRPGQPAGIVKIVLLGQPSQGPQSGSNPGMQSPVSPVAVPLPTTLAVVGPDPAPQRSQAEVAPFVAAAHVPAVTQQKRQARTSLHSRKGYRVTNK